MFGLSSGYIIAILVALSVEGVKGFPFSEHFLQAGGTEINMKA